MTERDFLRLGALGARGGWVTLGILAAALAAEPARAQHEHHASARHQAAAGVKLSNLDDEAGQALILRLGPLNLPAHSDHHAVAQAPDFFLTIPFDGWLVAYHPRLVDAAQQPLPGRLLHHVAFWNTARSDFLCPNKEEHIFGAGGEMNHWPAVPGVGYRVAEGDRIRISTMFHNPTETDYPNTYLQVRINYQREVAGGPRLRDVYPAWFDVQGCGNSGYDLEPGRSENTGQVNLRYAGMLLGAGGHMHDYGLQLLLENVTRKQEIIRLESELDAQDRILSMPTVRFGTADPAASPAGAADSGASASRLGAGDVIQVKAFYDNRTGKLLPDGAMGIVVGYFLPDDNAQMAALRKSPGKGQSKPPR